MTANRLVASILAVLAVVLANLGAALAQDGLARFNSFDDASEITVDHAAWDAFLGAYVRAAPDNRTIVDYAAVTSADRKALQDYINALEAVEPTTLSRDEAFAYWANLYNAVTVEFILDNYPVKSILRISSGLRPGPWRRDAVEVSGVTLSLDNIEHGILRGFWSDNRVHYAVNCASIGCPNLPMRAFRGAELDAMLDDGARAYINHPRGVSVDGGRITASSIYKWFKEDFGGDDAGVLAHFRKYAEPSLANKLDGATKIHKFDYNWDLNDIGS